jgi:predicted RNase H-like HicB family nuclease
MNKKTLRKRNKVMNTKNKHSKKHKRIKRKGKRFSRKQYGGLLLNLGKWDASLSNPEKITNFKQLTTGVIIFKLDTKTKQPDTKNPYIILEDTMVYTAHKQKKQISLIIQRVKPITSTSNIYNLTGLPSTFGTTGKPVIISDDEFNNWYYAKNSLPIDPTKKPEFSELNSDPERTPLKLNENLRSPFPIVYNKNDQQEYIPYSVSDHLSLIAGSVQTASNALSTYMSDALTTNNRLNKDKNDMHTELINLATNYLSRESGKVERTIDAIRRAIKAGARRGGAILKPTEYPRAIAEANRAVSAMYTVDVSDNIRALVGTARAAVGPRAAAAEQAKDEAIANAVKGVIDHQIRIIANNNLNANSAIGGAVKSIQNIISPGGIQYAALRTAAEASLSSNQGGIERAAKAAQKEAQNNQYQVLTDSIGEIPSVEAAAKNAAVNKARDIMAVKKENEEINQAMKDEINDRDPFKTQSKTAAVNAMVAVANQPASTAKITSSLSQNSEVQQRAVEIMGQQLSTWITANPQLNISPDLIREIITAIAESETTDEAVKKALAAYDANKTVSNRMASIKQPLTADLNRLAALPPPPAPGGPLDATTIINDMTNVANEGATYQKAVDNVKKYLQNKKIDADLITEIIAAGTNAGDAVINTQRTTEINAIITAGEAAANFNAAITTMEASATNLSRATIDKIINPAKEAGQAIVKNKVDEIISKIYTESVKANTVPNVARDAEAVVTNDIVTPLATAGVATAAATAAATAISDAALGVGGAAPTQQQIDDAAADIGKKIVDAASEGKSIQEVTRNAERAATAAGVALPAAQAIGAAATAARPAPSPDEIDDEIDDIIKKIIDGASSGKTVGEVVTKAESVARDLGMNQDVALAIKNYADNIGNSNPTQNDINNEGYIIIKIIVKATSKGKTIQEAAANAEAAAKKEGFKGRVLTEIIPNIVLRAGNASPSTPSQSTNNSSKEFIMVNLLSDAPTLVPLTNTTDTFQLNQVYYRNETLDTRIACLAISSEYMYLYQTSKLSVKVPINNIQKNISDLNRLIINDKIDRINQQAPILSTILPTGSGDGYETIKNDPKFLQVKLNYLNELIYFFATLNYNIPVQTLLQKSYEIPPNIISNINQIASDKFAQLDAKAITEADAILVNPSSAQPTVSTPGDQLPPSSNLASSEQGPSSDQVPPSTNLASGVQGPPSSIRESTPGPTSSPTPGTGPVTVVKVKVPANLKSGDQYVFTYQGHKYQINIPPNVSAGQFFKVHIKVPEIQPAAPISPITPAPSESSIQSEAVPPITSPSPSPINLKVQVPPNKKSGDKLRFNYIDNTYEVVIPQGVQTGQYFKLKLETPKQESAPASSSEATSVSTPESAQSQVPEEPIQEVEDQVVEPIQTEETGQVKPSFEVSNPELNKIIGQVGDKYDQIIPKLTASFITILETMLKTEQDPVKQDNIKTAIASLKQNNENFEKLSEQLNNVFKDVRGGPSIETNVSKLLTLFNKAQSQDKTAKTVAELDAIASVLAALAAGALLVGGTTNKTRGRKHRGQSHTRRNKY